MNKPEKPPIKTIQPQPGPQTAAFTSKADIIIYGGQAGGGKSWYLVNEPLRRIHNKGFRGGIFRRTYPQLKGQGGVWDECQEIYRACGARMREGQELDATFPSGANIAFLHLQHEKTKYDYQGHQFCCEVGTRIRTIRGLVAVEDLKDGDLVQTIGGFQKVLRVQQPRLAKCVVATVGDKSQVHTTDHQILTVNGWQSYDDMFCESHPPLISAPKECCDARKSELPSCELSRAHSGSFDSSSADRLQPVESIRLRSDRQCSSVVSSSSPQQCQGSDSVGFDDGIQASRQLPLLTCLALLHERTLDSAYFAFSPRSSGSEFCDARTDSLPGDSPERCLIELHRHDEQPRLSPKIYQAGLPPRAYAEQQIPSYLQPDDQGKVHKHIRTLERYAHPYTKADVHCSCLVEVKTCEMKPCGERLVVDVTVANESHYVSESGLINKNCYLGFDELTHFTESQFFYMLSRNRSTCGIRPYVRATCNPEPGWVADFLAWWIDQSTGLAIPERSGVVRYFIRGNDEKIYWGDTKEEIIEEFPEYSPEDILSVTFILATLDDNKILQKKDPGYKARLMSLSKIERDRLLGGNWKVAEGAQINGEWIRKYSTNAVEIECVFQDMLLKLPMAMMRRIATIDTAGTSKEKAAKDRGKEPSWSVCGVWDIVTRMSVNYQGRAVQLSEMIFLRYVWRKQVDWNGLRQGIDETLDTWNVTKAYIENAHFGQALKQEIKSCPCELIGPVLPGMGDRGEGAKLERAIASGMLSRFEHGKIFVPREPSDWLAAYLREIEAWTGKPDEVADQIDMTSYASYLSKKGASAWGGVIQTNQGMMR